MSDQFNRLMVHATHHQFPDDYIEDIKQPSEFPHFIRTLPRADYSADGGDAIRGYVLAADGLQLVFNENEQEMVFEPHRHAQSFGVVLQGWCELVIDGVSTIYRQGEVYHVPGGVTHYARQSANYKDIVIFNEPSRVPSYRSAIGKSGSAGQRDQPRRLEAPED